MDFDRFVENTRRPVPVAVVGTLAGLLLIGMHLERRALEKTLPAQRETALELNQSLEQLDTARAHYQNLRDLAAGDIMQFKDGLGNLAQSKRQLYEAGLSLQEERRLLEKQWDIMTTYLFLNPQLQRVFLMRGDQPLESYLLAYVPPKNFGDVKESVPSVVRIVSKERFAHPERGQSTEVNGQLEWIPPQVGTSVRSNALGEFVMFTNSRLILHGPPVNAQDHEKFPHICLGLSREAARKLYRNTFIGTKIVVTKIEMEAD